MCKKDATRLILTSQHVSGTLAGSFWSVECTMKKDGLAGFTVVVTQNGQAPPSSVGICQILRVGTTGIELCIHSWVGSRDVERWVPPSFLPLST
jgi:hypothetical protein